MKGALEISGLSVSPGGSDPVVRQVALSAAAGDRLVIAGPSGAGKTTLLRAIAGLEPSTEGSISLSGRNLAGVPAHRRRVAMVFQEPRLLPHLTVLDNVALPLRAAGTEKAARHETARSRLAEVGLEQLGSRAVAGLSGGEQQRVALARALCGEPELLLLDEPLAALDPNRRENLRDLILAIQEERRLTTVLVTHDRAEAAEIGQSIALMINGVIEQQDEPRALFERPASTSVARFFGSRNLIELEAKAGESGTSGLWAIRPEQVIAGSGRRSGRVIETSYRGTYLRVLLRWRHQEIEIHTDVSDPPMIGDDLSFDLPEDALWRIPGT